MHVFLKVSLMINHYWLLWWLSTNTTISNCLAAILSHIYSTMWCDSYTISAASFLENHVHISWDILLYAVSAWKSIHCHLPYYLISRVSCQKGPICHAGYPQSRKLPVENVSMSSKEWSMFLFSDDNPFLNFSSYICMIQGIFSCDQATVWMVHFVCLSVTPFFTMFT